MNNKGLTLIEMMIVVAIVATLTAIGLVNNQRVWLQVQENKMVAELKSIYTAINMYELEKGESPNTWEDLRMYITKDVDILKEEYELNN